MELVRLAFRPRALRNSLLIAAVVGIILNLINQGDRLFAAGMPVDWFHLLLNFLVPFCVSSISAALNARRREGSGE